jgi:hypothetical protein
MAARGVASLEWPANLPQYDMSESPRDTTGIVTIANVLRGAPLLWTRRRRLAQISFAGRVADPIHVPGSIDRDKDNRPL